MGLLDPATSDGRVIFFLPWQKQTIAGTTDLPCEITHHPRPTEDEIMFILQEIKNYLNPDVEGIINYTCLIVINCKYMICRHFLDIINHFMEKLFQYLFNRIYCKSCIKQTT